MCTSKHEHALPWIVVLGVETLIIILGNIATVIVFWKNRSQLKQTCLFLINLTVADLMVGIGNIESVVVKIHKSFIASSSCKTTWGDYVVSEEFFGCASIGFLALISLERLYAVVWPFRVNTKIYFQRWSSVASFGYTSCSPVVRNCSNFDNSRYFHVVCNSVLVTLLNNHLVCIFCNFVLFQERRSKIATK